MKWILAVLLFSTLAAANTDCSHLIGDCEYYECVRAQKGCLRYTYLDNYGLKYCKLASQLADAPTTSTRLSRMIYDARLCLMEEVDRFYTDVNCPTIRSRAFRSHSKCYVNSGFCSLTNWEKRQLIRKVRSGLSNRRSIPVFFKVMGACLNPF